jgi:hypothetical protein
MHNATAVFFIAFNTTSYVFEPLDPISVASLIFYYLSY